MNNNSSLTPLPKDDEVPCKRQKLDAINSSSHNPSDNQSQQASECLMRELSALRIKLSNTETTATELYTMKREIDEAFDEKEAMLETQVRLERETIKHLEVRLETAKRSIQETNGAQVTVEMSPLKSKIREKMESLLTENARLNKHAMFLNSEKTPICPKPQENEPNVHTQPEKWMEMKMKQVLTEDMGTLRSTLQCHELKRVDIQTQKFKSETLVTADSEKAMTLLEARAHDLEEQLQSAKNMISTLREAVKEKLLLEEAVSTMTKRLQVAGAVKQCVVHGKCEESSSRVDDNESRVSGMPPAASKHEKQRSGGMKKKAGEFDSQAVKNESSLGANGNDDSQAQGGNKSHDNDQDKAASCQNFWVKTRVCDVSVSHKKFFNIEWKKYYNRIHAHELRCKRCPVVKPSIRDIEDHIWVQHCGGTFRCPCCGDQSHSFSQRDSVSRHMRQVHNLARKYRGSHQTSKKSKTIEGNMMNRNDEEFGYQGVNYESTSDANNNEDSQLAGEDKSPSTQQSDDSDKGADKAQRLQQNCRLKVGDNYVVVSHPKFLTMQWEKHYEKIARRNFACKKCSVVKQTKFHMVDHVWNRHYGGTFECPHCSNPSRSFACRFSIGNHMKQFHSNECSSNM